VVINRDGEEDVLSIDKIEGVEEEKDPFLGVIFKIYTTKTSFIIVNKLKSPDQIQKLKNMLRAKNANLE
jgi:hypothetical protein